MTYSRTTNLKLKQRAKQALSAWQHGDCSAGYDVLRYAEQNMYSSRSDLTAELLCWYPLHAGYVLLRAASRGELYVDDA